MAEVRDADQAWMTLVQHFKERAHGAEEVAEKALKALADTLYFLADVHPEDRNLAIDEALTFYNEQCPDCMVVPSGTGLLRIVHEPLTPT